MDRAILKLKKCAPFQNITWQRKLFSERSEETILTEFHPLKLFPFLIYEPAHDKTNKIACAPSKVRSAWASAQSDQSSLCAHWIAKDPSFLHAESEDWLDWADAQADLSLGWVHMPFCWFCHALAHVREKALDHATNQSRYVRIHNVWIYIELGQYSCLTHFHSAVAVHRIQY